MQIRKGNTIYKSPVASYAADLAGDKGPVPGAIEIGITGTDIDFSELNTLGGICELRNLDSSNFVTFGMYDGDANFYPLGELLAGEQFVLRLSRYLGSEWDTGTGTTAETDNVLRIIADTAPCSVYIGAFDA